MLSPAPRANLQHTKATDSPRLLGLTQLTSPRSHLAVFQFNSSTVQQFNANKEGWNETIIGCDCVNSLRGGYQLRSIGAGSARWPADYDYVDRRGRSAWPRRSGRNRHGQTHSKSGKKPGL